MKSFGCSRASEGNGSTPYTRLFGRAPTSGSRRLSPSKFIQVLACLLLFAVGVNAYATSPCNEWKYAAGSQGYFYDSGWRLDPSEVCDDYAQHCLTPTISTGCPVTNTVNYRVDSTSPVFEPASPITHPAGYNCRVTVSYTCLSGGCAGQSFVKTGGPKGLSYRTNPTGCQVYVSATSPPASECGSSCNSVGDPINPANGSVHATEVDLGKHSSTLEFKRFYNSIEDSGGHLGAGWRHSFSRSLKPVYSGSTFRPYQPSPDTSSLYNTETAACTSGFAQIKSRVSTWANATASYANGTCILKVGMTTIGILPLLYTSPPTPAPGSTVLIGVNAIRDDGQFMSFMVAGDSIVAPLSITLKLQQTSNGYILTDAEDNVETYDADGRLLAITSRGGVMRSMGYDAVGRLSTVTDSFGHGLTLTYDSESRLSTMTRQ